MAGAFAVHAFIVALFVAGAAGAQTPPPEKSAASDGNSITVPGRVERPVTPPPGDTRSWLQRFRDRSAFDRCVMRAANREQETGNYPVAATPEELCSQDLGMRDRNAMPASRQRFRR